MGERLTPAEVVRKFADECDDCNMDSTDLRTCADAWERLADLEARNILLQSDLDFARGQVEGMLEGVKLLDLPHVTDGKYTPGRKG